MKRAEPSFSLIEMLVVIAVIAILIGLLMPVLGSVREKARLAKCTANLKQLHEAAMDYATANGEFPYGASSREYDNNTGAWNQDHKGWLDWFRWPATQNLRTYFSSVSAVTCITNGSLFSYVGDIRVYLCPTFGQRFKAVGPYRSYGLNGSVSSARLFSITDASRRLLFADQSYYRHKIRDFGKGGTITNNSTYALSEGGDWNDNTTTVRQNNRAYRQLDGEITATLNGAVPYETIGAIHDGNGNCVFVDGHVERVWWTNSVAICAGTWSGID